MQSFKCSGIAKHFRGVRAIENASLEIRAGEVRALFGGNGSGKSTLAKILGGAVAPDRGDIFIDGKQVKISSPSDAKSLGIVATSQELSLLYNMGIEENLLFNALPVQNKLFVDRRKIEQQAQHYLERLGLTGDLHVGVADLPDNKKYLVEFGKALAQNPELLILDEITSALFLQDFEIVKDVVLELSEKGVSVVFISHRMSEIYKICESVTVMRSGVAIGTYSLRDMPMDDLLHLMTGENEPAASEAGIPSTDRTATSTESAGQRTPLLSVTGLTLPEFGKPINLDAYAGGFIGVSGIQGQGQSEFVRTLFGMRGHVQVQVMGVSKTIGSPIDAIRSEIGFLSGNRETEGAFPDRPVIENMETVFDYVLSRGRINFPRIVDDFGIVLDNRRQPIKSLSGGNQQKVIISRWVEVNPKILLADDPTKGVDVRARREVHQIIKRLVEGGACVIMSSSDDEELVDIANLIPDTRILIFYGGEIRETLTGERITVPNIISSSLMTKGAVET